MAEITFSSSQNAHFTNNTFEPEIYTLKYTEDRNAIESLLTKIPDLQVHDAFEGQLKELIKLHEPTRRFSENDLKDAVKEKLSESPAEEQGVWVYYPWSRRLIHILDEKDFIDVRTNRNQYKITPEERQELSKKKIGVVGLSVGQSIAATMAMERIFGEIRLADFDKIELSNLNRIRTGLQNLDMPKVVVVAREIKEIDPFLKVRCFPEGLTEDNMNEFLMEGGKLDILVDECDSLDIKVSARLRARELGIPVVMDTSDRGMIDIERFDLEPQRPILHGAVEEEKLGNLSELTPQERMALVMQMVGGESLSERAKYSMSEIGKSLTTWPQLASSVVLGGAVGTDVCRRICLGSLQVSGRFYIDIEELINNDKR